MISSVKYNVAQPGQPSREMTVTEINMALASGEISADCEYWTKGMPKWEKLKDLPGIIIPIAPRTRPVSSHLQPTRPPMPSTDTARSNPSIPVDPSSFWGQADNKPRLRLWSPLTCLLLSLAFTPFMGSFLIARNHRAAEETVWRSISWFWMLIWAVFIISGISIYLANIPSPIMYWVIGFSVLSIFWLFTCALPHAGFLKPTSHETAWRSDWGKPVGYGFLAWVIIFTVALLSH